MLIGINDHQKGETYYREERNESAENCHSETGASNKPNEHGVRRGS
jgi:hypothetical protein